MMRDPFEQLEASHRRLEERLAELGAAATAPAGGGREAALGTVEAVLDYFDRSVTRHEADEEQSLFPRLRAHPELAATLDMLEREHREHERLHADLREGYQDPCYLAELAGKLATAYRAHILEEERILFPAARRLLTEADLAAMAAEMEARRGRRPGSRR
jgi:iron-sulfur cluster repair protein YtfE (RIC family)